MSSAVPACSTPPSQGSLRKRMHLLHRAHSLTSLGKTKISEGLSHSKSVDTVKDDERSDNSSPMDYESGIESSEEEKLPKKSTFSRAGPPGAPAGSSKHQSKHPTKGPPARPRVNTTSLNSPSSSTWKEPSPMSPTSRSWYEFDLAVVVALVSPIGNWLTGGDHIKNLLLVVLLIFYLHQIIEIPWSLYRRARPRRRSPQFPPSPSAPIEVRYAHLAATELQRLELFFLFCTLISPLAGALLLRYATAAVLGPDSVSWFSTGLFVLATGMRPWAHLVDRMKQRTSELHDFIHYPEAQARQGSTDETEKRIAELEKSLAKLKKDVVLATEDVYDYVDDAVGLVKEGVREARLQQDEKMSRLAESVSHKLGQRPFARIGSMLTPMWVSRLVATRSSTTEVCEPHPSVATQSSSPPSPSQRSPSPRPKPLLDLVDEEEEVVYESFPLLVRPLVYASRVASQLIGIFLLPFSAAFRMIFGRY